MKLAAIDIGSNAVRLLVCKINMVNDKPKIIKELLVRSPIRLGEQAFLDEMIYENKIVLLSKAMVAYRNLMDIYGVEHYRAFATSAMREAQNNQVIVERIKKESSIAIEVVSGLNESTTIFESYRDSLTALNEETFLSIDVGGGSTELVLFHKGQIIDNRSFKIGTLRVKNFLVPDEEWAAMKVWLEEHARNYPDGISGLGSGGNIIKIQKLYFDDKNDAIKKQTLRAIKTNLESYTLRERIVELGLKPDRADVIVPAADIFCKVMEWGQVSKLYVPKVGLSDGIIKEIYKEFAASNLIET